MSRGLVVRAEDSRSRGCGFESRCILDEKSLQCNLKRPKNGENKDSQMGQTAPKKYRRFLFY